jgi:hypothetical protein
MAPKKQNQPAPTGGVSKDSLKPANTSPQLRPNFSPNPVLSYDQQQQLEGGTYQPGLSNMYGRYINPEKYGELGFSIPGSQQEQEGALGGLNLANILYGQNIFETGQDVSDIRGKLKARSEGSDPISEAIRSQKSGAIANAQRNLAGAGVKGAAAAGAIEAIGRQKDAQINESLYGQQRQSLSDLRSFTGNTLAGTVSLMQGGKGEAVQMPKAPDPQGMFGTVICTELHKQGYMSDETYAKDSAYGKLLPIETIVGYHFWAIPVVNLMKKSPLVTTIIKPFALSWAKHIAGEKKSMFGYLCQFIGEPVCSMIGHYNIQARKERV